MEKPIVFLFSGQGSQYFQMGKELFDEHPLFRKWMLGLDDIVKNIVGESLLEQVYAKEKTKEQKFSRTLYTHPAIFMVEYALAQVLMENGITPNYVLGSSMGEFTAAAIADILSLEETLEMLINQAVLLETHCEKGEMLAIFHDPNLYHENPLLYENSELASVNFDSHFVVSGKSDQLSIITEVLKSKGILYETLPVSHAFHSSLIDPVEPYYQDLLKNKLYRLPKIPFISCLYSKILTKIPDNYLWDIIRKPTLFSKTIQELEQNQNSIYLDLGPSGTLNNFIKRNIDRNSNSESYPIMTMYYQDTKNLQRIEKLISNMSLLSIRKEDKKMITYIFPGQGSQHKGMGGTLFDEFEELTIKADKILGYSIKELCLHDLNQQLGKTQFTQPALYVVNALSFLKRIKETGTTPEYVAGHSLGEYNALFAAGAFDFETGLKMVKKRGELMSQATEGGMAAVIGLTVEQVNHILIENGLTSIDIANHNSPSQIVIAGPKADIEHAQPFFEAADAKMYIPLNVSGAFHSRYMHEAKEIFEGYLEDLNFKEMKIPVIANVHARPYKQTDIKRNLVQQITHPVKWTDSIRYLMGLGKMEIEEIGPGRVLTKLMETIQKEAEPLVIDVDEEENNAEQQNQANTFPIITASSLGDEQFKKDYGLKYAYITGAMYKGVSSEKLVVKIGKAGMLGFYGTGGLSLEKIEEAIQYIQRECSNGEAYGMNLLHDPGNPLIEEKTVDLYLKHSVRIVEASGYISITPSLTRYRAKGLVQNNDGTVAITNKIIAKVSRPEVAEAFLSPAPDNIVEKLIQDNIITWEEANLLREAPLADDICVEADSGGHTDRRTPYALMPAMLKLRDEMMKKYGYSRRVRIGAAGGIGTPEAAAAAFMLGADFIVTGSINQCTVEANTNDIVKDLLQQANIQDTDYAPSEEMFEIGAKVQVLKKGVFFPARANKLYDLYRHYDTLDAIDEKTTKMIQEKYFHRSFEEVYQEVKAYKSPEEIEKAERNPKYKMALIFKWYLGYSTHLAMSGNQEHRVDYQIQCGPALGAFNQWVKGTPLENWRNRHVDEIGERLMKETAELLNQRFLNFIGTINFIHSEEALQVMSL